MTPNRGHDDRSPAVAAAPPTVGTVLRGTYRIVRQLAEGGCGDVYVATHVRLGNEVAVKILHAALGGNDPVLVRFRHEADIMSALRHPHIVQILDFDITEQGVPFLVMELLVGRSLSEGMAAGTPFEPRAAFHIIDQIAQALTAAHAYGIVHLDLKPDNVILVSTDGRDDFVKVIDFGISRAGRVARPASEARMSGTPEYMAPEQAAGLTEDIDHRSDQFALAGVAYRLLTGHDPFRGLDPLALLYRVINGMQHPPSERAPWLGPGVDVVIGRAMSKRPADRYPDVAAFTEALRGAIDVVAIDRRGVTAAATARAFDRRAAEEAKDFETPAQPVEGDTLPFIRTPRRTGRRLRPGSVLLALAAAAAAVWFFPATRGTTRAAWDRAGARARSVVGAVTPATTKPSRSGNVSMP